MKHSVLLIMFICLPFSIFSQEKVDPFRINTQLGRGINLGNTLEGPSEGAWGAVWNKEYFEIIAELGFNHVRIPVRWETSERSLSEPPYTISADFLSRIKTVVDAALDNGLMAVINMHHHDDLFENPDKEKARFLAQWNQIADHFREYPNTLLFEVLNEPHGNLTPEKWNRYFADALREIRATNPYRTVLMGTAEYGGLRGIEDLVLPADKNIILTLHYYNPFQFTHQGAGWSGPEAQTWLGTKWYGTASEMETVKDEFKKAGQFAENHNIPIHVGEFGAYEKADMASRVRWTGFLARWFEEQKYSWAYWEFNAGFGIYDPVAEELRMPLVNALLHDPMPEARSIEKTAVVYQNSFTESKDGWRLNTQHGAVGAVTRKNDALEILLVNGGTEGWHAQLVKTGIELKNGKMYRLSFTASSDSERSLTAYAGSSSAPWTAYSGYTTKNLSPNEETFIITWTMKSGNDPRARIVFDLGSYKGTTYVDQVTLEEIEIRE